MRPMNAPSLLLAGALLALAGCASSPAAPPAEWLRRVSFELTGLPPTPGELDAFLADPSPRAKERVVDELLAQDGVMPTPESVADGSYPVRRTLILLFRDEADRTGNEILAFLRSAQGHKIIRGLGFVPAMEIKEARAAE